MDDSGRSATWQLVRDAYGVAAVDPRLPMQSWMADALLSARPERRAARANTLDLDTAWTHLLRHHLGLPSGNPDVESIIAWSTDRRIAGRFEKLAPTILMEARRVGRAVVLTSDHGHVLEADGARLPGDGESRWRSAASPTAEPEIEIGGARVRAATGQERIVLPWSEAVRYGSNKLETLCRRSVEGTDAARCVDEYNRVSGTAQRHIYAKFRQELRTCLSRCHARPSGKSG